MRVYMVDDDDIKVFVAELRVVVVEVLLLLLWPHSLQQRPAAPIA